MWVTDVQCPLSGKHESAERERRERESGEITLSQAGDYDFHRSGHNWTVNTAICHQLIVIHWIGRVTWRETQRQRDTETEGHRDTETEGHRDRETEGHRDRETEEHRDRETVVQAHSSRKLCTETRGALKFA